MLKADLKSLKPSSEKEKKRRKLDEVLREQEPEHSSDEPMVQDRNKHQCKVLPESVKEAFSLTDENYNPKSMKTDIRNKLKEQYPGDFERCAVSAYTLIYIRSSSRRLYEEELCYI